jgi:FkbM family methyltransferase
MQIADMCATARRVCAYVVRHPANRDRRARALARAALFQVRRRAGRTVTATLVGGVRVRVYPGSAAGSAVVYGSPPDWHEMRVWARLIRPGDWFVDVGANIGVYALWAAYHGARVTALEPDPVAAARARENVALNRLPIDVREAALADRPGRVPFSTGLDTTNRIVRAGDEAVRTVAATTLDDVIAEDLAAATVFLKIDVEGAEELVLAGAPRALASGRIAAMQLEWNGCGRANFGTGRESLAALLASHGYGLYRATNGRLEPCGSAETNGNLFALRDRAVLSRLR